MRRGHHSSTLRAMGGDQSLQSLSAVTVEAVERLIEQPQRCTGCGNAGERRALGLPGRKQPHRHVGERGKPERIQRGIETIGGSA